MALQYATTLKDLPGVFRDDPLDKDDLETFYMETVEIRTGEAGMSPIEDIYEACLEPSDRNSHLLMGHRGCGKSTELNRLAMRLEREHFPVAMIYCDRELDRSNMVYSDVLMLMAEAILSLAKQFGCSIPPKSEEVLERFRSEVENEVVEVSEAEASIEAGAELESPRLLSGFLRFFASLKASLKYNQESRTTIREKVQTRVSEWLRSINLIADEITKKQGKQPVLIFEDLDKGDTWEIFHLHSEQLTGVKFPTIYTFPISLSYSPEFAEMESFFDAKRLPMIKTRNKTGGKNPPGVQVITSIINSRADPALFEPGVTDYMIDMTGGALRDLFSAIREASLIARRRKFEQISKEVASLSLRDLKSRLKIRIDASDFAFLREIHQNHFTFSDRGKLLKMMGAGAVLEYNGDLWYDLHPLIAEYLAENGQLHIVQTR